MLGSGATGSRKNAPSPASARPSASSVVAIGRWMKSRDQLNAAQGA